MATVKNSTSESGTTKHLWCVLNAEVIKAKFKEVILTSLIIKIGTLSIFVDA